VLVTAGLILTGLYGFRYWLAHFALLVERLTGGEALRRSKEFWLAHTLRVFGFLFGSGLVTAVATFVALFIMLMPLAALGLAAPPEGSLAGPLALQLLIGLARGVVGFWGIAFSILFYKDLAAAQPLEQGRTPVEAAPAHERGVSELS